MALARRAPRDPPEFAQERPEGVLLWGHATSPTRAAILMQLATRLRAFRPDVSLLLTSSGGMAKPEHLKSYMIWQPLPKDSVPFSEAFLDHWKPDMCLWTGGYLRPAMILCAVTRGIAMVLLDVDEDGFNAAKWNWLPDLARASLQDFSAILVRTEAAAQLLLKLGVPKRDITITGPLQEGGNALPCNDKERSDLSIAFAGRPVWLAAMAQMGELKIILSAHKEASRMAHRLLLILVPDNPSDGPEFMQRLEMDNWRVAMHSKGEIPGENTQILLADTDGDMGLWYRLAPITFMASSLVPGHGGRDPYEPAALGSAILYGPNVRSYLATYSRFANAGAARILRDSKTLSAALINLLSPDQAALMATAAWGVASEGAEVTDQVIDLIQDTLDTLEYG